MKYAETRALICRWKPKDVVIGLLFVPHWNGKLQFDSVGAKRHVPVKSAPLKSFLVPLVAARCWKKPRARIPLLKNRGGYKSSVVLSAGATVSALIGRNFSVIWNGQIAMNLHERYSVSGALLRAGRLFVEIQLIFRCFVFRVMAFCVLWPAVWSDLGVWMCVPSQCQWGCWSVSREGDDYFEGFIPFGRPGLLEAPQGREEGYGESSRCQTTKVSFTFTPTDKCRKVFPPIS